MNPHIHQVAKAAGITDLSAKVYGSRNPVRVIKLAVAMLHGGSNPVGASPWSSFHCVYLPSVSYGSST